MYFTTIRGPGGAGKSTATELLIRNQAKNSPMSLCADFLWHDVVCEKSPEKFYSLIGKLVETYLHEGVSVVLEGMLYAKNEKGILMLNDVYDIAEKENAKINSFFLTAPKEILLKRETEKYAEMNRKFNNADFNEWFEKSIPEKDEFIIFTDKLNPEQVLEQIVSRID